MPSLLAQGEPSAFTVLNENGKANVVLVCDHASNRVPLQLQTLGLTAEQMASHIAWDIGALWVATYLSKHLDAPLVFSNYSRLVVDCNRCPEREDLVPASSANIAIPGNENLSQADIQHRRTSLFDPYHQAIESIVQSRGGNTTLLLSIHSFTPILNSQDRPWPIGVCYENDSDMAKRWRSALQEQISELVGDNEPYAIEVGVDYTLPVHAARYSIPAIMLEIRQDQIANEVAAHSWGEIIAKAYVNALSKKT